MPGETPQTDGARPKDRAEIARWIICTSGVLLVGLTIVLIFLNGVEGSKTAFTMLVPMIGTWMGTVIAYYFSGENFQRASDSVNRMVGHVLEDKLRAIPVTDAMIARANMSVVVLPAGDDGRSVNLKQGLIDRYNDTVTRLPVLDDTGVARYIIHQSEVFEFVTKRTAAQTPSESLDFGKLTLKDFLDSNDEARFVSGTMAFVRADQTLSDAKARMEAIPDCQDVFVTADGSASKPVQGWITNVMISRRAKL